MIKPQAGPSISVVVLCYNQAPFILECLNGIAMQKGEFQLELIISDDASTDQTPHLIQTWTKEYFPQARLLFRKKNGGVAFNWLDTISHATGKYIALCEGDDFWTDPNKLQRQIQALESQPDASLCWHEVDVLEQGVIRRYPYAPLIMERSGIKEAILNHSIPTCSMVFKNLSPWNWPSFFFKAFSIDVLVQLHILSQGYALKTEGKSAVYRQHPGGVSKQKKRFWVSALNRLDMLKQFDAHSQGEFRPFIQSHILREGALLWKYPELPWFSLRRYHLAQLLWFAQNPSSWKEKKAWFYTLFLPKIYDRYLLWRQSTSH